MDDEEEDEVPLSRGTVIESSRTNYVVIKLLGEGGFGAVYKVYDQKDKLKEYAMKVEKKLKGRRHSKLKMEVAILKLVPHERIESHFTLLIDRGKKEKFCYIVMQLVGSSLASLKMSRPTRVFSVSTAMGAGIQCLEACQDLHAIGFIHRDLKPANYACGLGDRRRVVYILDFGIARKIRDVKGELKQPRQYGTVRFASLACHRNIEMSPKDDCESWFYLLLDFISPRGLLWKSVPDRNIVMSMKKEMRSSKRILDGDLFERNNNFQQIAFSGIKCKDELMQIMDYLDKLRYQDHVNYKYIYTILQTATKVAGGDLSKPYDWEVGDDLTQTMTNEEKPRLKIAALKNKRRKMRKQMQRKKEKTRRSRSSVGRVKVGQAQASDYYHHRIVPISSRMDNVVGHEKRRSKASAESSSMSTSSVFSVASKRIDPKKSLVRKRKKSESSSSSSSTSETRSSAGFDKTLQIKMKNMSI
ncbi:hypothetical protein DICVIV_00698 [Dictyocaulus viviparus]|uniref:Protein kinase domain-containing protein n=1 Tax=Dictyocaulus viviparus TaxID=29172 RepID=A0A0D8Y830_DICVI|nr:hypothetical protein DICVIV_00698 [Dictyocaulus viviparus]